MKHKALFAISLLALTACAAVAIEASGPCTGGVFIGNELDLIKSRNVSYGDYYTTPPIPILFFSNQFLSANYFPETHFVAINYPNQWLRTKFFQGYVNINNQNIPLPQLSDDYFICKDSNSGNYYSRR